MQHRAEKKDKVALKQADALTALTGSNRSLAEAFAAPMKVEMVQSETSQGGSRGGRPLNALEAIQAMSMAEDKIAAIEAKVQSGEWSKERGERESAIWERARAAAMRDL